jgi:phosphatidylserine synthase 2
MTNFRDSVFRRPHPLFWRFVHGAAVLYVLLLVFAVFQSPNSIRHLLTYVDPSLGARLHHVFPFPNT